jgi:hypothetical protein
MRRIDHELAIGRRRLFWIPMEETMRIFRNTPARPESTLGSADTLPANAGSLGSRMQAGGSAMVDRATRVYKENPKLVGGVALLASALLLNRLRRPVR